MLTLQLFGGCTLVSNGEAVAGPAGQRRRLALLALIAASPNRSVSRDKLVAYFWPDEDRDRARHFLSDSLFRLRKTLGNDVVLTAGDDVRVNAELVNTDVAQFETLIQAGSLADAAALYRGPFLDGFFISNAPEFERWTDVERDRLARRQARCLEQLATLREAAGDWSSAAEWWRLLAAHDPYSSRVALRTMRALDANGDAAGALRYAHEHETLIREQLALESDPAVSALVAQLRIRSATRSPPPSVRVADVSPPSARPTPAASAPAAPGPATTPAIPGRRLTPRRAIVGAALAAIAATAVFVTRTEQIPLTGNGRRDRGSHVLASAGSLSETRLASRSRRDAALELYTQGRYMLSKGQFEAEIHRRALVLFQQAAERDPSFAPAYAGMADVYNHADDPAKAKEAALHALSLDSSLAEAHTSLAYVLAFYEHRWDGADSALRRAIAANPRYVLAHLRLANVLAAQGRIDEAVAAVERARAIQPESFVVMLNRGLMAELAGRPNEAIAHFQAALVLEPGRRDAQEMLATAYWGEERYAEAQGLMRSIGNIAGVASMSGSSDTMANLAPLLAASAVTDSIRKAAAIYVRLGRSTEAFEQLERLFDRRDKFLALHLRNKPFVSLRDDPRYARLLRRMGLR